MKNFNQNGVGVATHDGMVNDTYGTGLLPVQVRVDSGSPSYRLLGRVAPDAPWVEIREATTGALLESISWVPYVAVEVLSAGNVTCWIGER